MSGWQPGPEFPVHAEHARGVRRGPQRIPEGTVRLPRGAWSRYYAACVDCGTTASPHAAFGRCYVCHKVARRRGGRDGSDR